MRVTSQTQSFTVLEALQKSIGRVQDMQTMLATGRRINKYSDAPADATASLRLRSEETDWNVFARAVDDAIDWYGTQDRALQDSVNVLQRVRELVVQASSGGNSAEAREGAATEIEGLRDHLMALANSKYLGKSVFGGFADKAVDQVAGVWTYVGDAGEVKRRIEPDLTVKVNGDGQEIFGFNAGTDVFTLLDRIATDIRAGDTTALGGADLVDLDARLKGLFEGLATVGAATNRAESTRSRNLQQRELIMGNRSTLEDADMLEAVVGLQQAELGYQAALGAVSRLTLPSLAQFLR